MRAFCSPNPGSAFSRRRISAPSGSSPGPDGGGVVVPVVTHGRAQRLGAGGHRTREAVNRRALLEHLDEGIRVVTGDRRGIDRSDPVADLRRARRRRTPWSPAGRAACRRSRARGFSVRRVSASVSPVMWRSMLQSCHSRPMAECAGRFHRLEARRGPGRRADPLGRYDRIGPDRRIVSNSAQSKGVIVVTGVVL